MLLKCHNTKIKLLYKTFIILVDAGESWIHKKTVEKTEVFNKKRLYGVSVAYG